MFGPWDPRRPFPPRFFGPPPSGRFGRFRRRWNGEGPGPGRRFDFRFGGPDAPRRGRRFGRGDLKYVILDLLKDQPRHGYDVIRALEERFHGFYSPSPGSVYPTLQLLEDQGYVTSREQDGKRVYAVTDAGRRFLGERAEAVAGVRERMAAGWGAAASPELQQLLQEVRLLAQFVFQQGAGGALGNPEKLRRLRAVVARARQEIEAIFRDGGQPSGPSSGPSAGVSL